MLSIFFIVLLIIFMPIFHGDNVLNSLDNLFNSISKGSANYIAELRKKVKIHEGKPLKATITLQSETQANRSSLLLEQAGFMAAPDGDKVALEGDIAHLITQILNDAERMYLNDGEKLKNKYGYNERQVLYDWWVILTETEKALKRQKFFSEAKDISLLQKKAVETGYNYYGIEAKSAGQSFILIFCALAFYVGYTLWYGYGILYLFDGFGLKIGH